MVLLALDTSLEACSVAVLAADRVTVRSEPLARGHAERIMPMIGAVMAEAGVGYPDLGRIAVTIGPGSFTGVRVGVSVARGLALVLGVPAVGVATLAALAADPATGEGVRVAAIDAKRGEVYVAVHEGTREIAPPAALALAEAARAVPEGVPIVGSGAAGLDAAMAEIGRRAGPLLPLAAPAIKAVARLGAAAVPPFASPAPLYLRAPDAKPQAGSGLLGERPPA